MRQVGVLEPKYNVQQAQRQRVQTEGAAEAEKTVDVNVHG